MSGTRQRLRRRSASGGTITGSVRRSTRGPLEDADVDGDDRSSRSSASRVVVQAAATAPGASGSKTGTPTSDGMDASSPGGSGPICAPGGSAAAATPGVAGTTSVGSQPGMAPGRGSVQAAGRRSAAHRARPPPRVTLHPDRPPPRGRRWARPARASSPHRRVARGRGRTTHTPTSRIRRGPRTPGRPRRDRPRRPGTEATCRRPIARTSGIVCGPRRPRGRTTRGRVRRAR